MGKEREEKPGTEGEEYLVPDAPETSAEEERAAVRKQLSDSTGAEAAEDPDLGVGLRGGGAERVRGYE